MVWRRTVTPFRSGSDAARTAAEAIIHLHHVRHAKRSLIEDLRRQPARFRGSEFKLFRALEQILDGRFRPDSEDELDQVLAYLGDTDADEASDVDEAEIILASIVAQNPRELRRMAEYERKGISRRAKALRRLALERIEAERRREGDEPVPPVSDLTATHCNTATSWRRAHYAQRIGSRRFTRSGRRAVPAQGSRLQMRRGVN